MWRTEAPLWRYRSGVRGDVVFTTCCPLCQVALVQEIRVRLGPSFHISYTIPCLSEQFEPWASVIPAIIADIDAVNVMAYDYYWDVSISSSQCS